MVNQSMGDAVFYDGKMIYFDNRMQAICECDLKTRQAKIIAVYNPNDGKEYIAYKIHKKDEDYYMVSTQFPAILKYCGTTGGFQRLIPGNMEDDYWIGCSFLRQDQIFLIPQKVSKHPVLVFRMSDGLFTEDRKWMLQFSNQRKADDFCSLHMYMCGEECWGAIFNSNRYFRYHLGRRQLDIFELERKDIHLDSAYHDGKSLWMTQSDTSDLIYIDDKEHILKLEAQPMVNDSREYSWIVGLQNEIVVLPRTGRRIIVVGKADLKVHVMEIRADMLQGVTGTKNMYCVEYHNEILVLPWGLGRILTLSEQRDTMTAYKMYFDLRDVNTKLAQRKVIPEAGIAGLFSDKGEERAFYSYLLSKDRRNVHLNIGPCVGENIFRILTDD